MPQMSPMSWTFIFLICTGFALLTMTNMPVVATSSTSTKSLKKKENIMKW